jgi:hypothetical protein
MKTIIRTLGIVLSLTPIFSCGKHSDDSNWDYSGPKLSKVMVWDSTHPLSGIEIFEFRYDGKNRVTTISHSIGDSANGQIRSMPYDSTQWFYKGNALQPYKSTSNQIYKSYDLYFFYDNQGRLISDSSITNNCNCYYVKKYNWFGNKVITSGVSGFYSIGTTSPTRDSSIINENNYLATFNITDPSKNWPGRFYTYDDKINPANTMNIHAATSFTTIGGLPSVGYSKNNATQITNSAYVPYTANPIGILIAQTVAYKYNYNANNLPVDCEVSNNSPHSMRIKFYYSN